MQPVALLKLLDDVISGHVVRWYMSDGLMCGRIEDLADRLDRLHPEFGKAAGQLFHRQIDALN